MSGSQSSTRRLVSVLMSVVMVLSVIGMGGAGLAGAQETDAQPTYELQFDGNSDTPYAFGVPGPTDQTFGDLIIETGELDAQQVDDTAGGTIYELENGEWTQLTDEDNVDGLQAYVLTGNDDTVQAQVKIAQDDEGQFRTASLSLDAGTNLVTPTAQGDVGDSLTFQISDGSATQVQNPYAEPSVSPGTETQFSQVGIVDDSGEEVNPFAGYFLISDSGQYTSTINTGNNQVAADDGLNIDATVETTSLTATNDNDQKITVTVEANEQLSDLTASDGSDNAVSGVGEDGDFSETANDDGTYTYEATYDAGADGEYTVSLDSASDTNENTDNEPGLSNSVSIDTTVETTSLTATNDNAQEITVTVEADEQLSDLSASDGSDNAVSGVGDSGDFSETANDGGMYTYEATYDAGADGEYTVTLDSASDTNENTDNEPGLDDTVSIDTTVETTSLTATNNNAQEITVTVEADEQLSDLTASDGSDNAVSGVGDSGDFTETANDDDTYTYEATYDAGADGDYTVTLDSVSDTNSNTDDSPELDDTVSIDTTAPEISAFSVDNTEGQTVEVSFDSNEEVDMISVTGDRNAPLDQSDFDENSDGDGFTYTATLSEGTDGTFGATLDTAEDAAGNDGASDQIDSATVDTMVETTSLTATNDNGQEITVTVEADEQLSDLSATVDGTTLSGVGTGFSETDNNDGTYTYEATYDAGANGEYTVTLDSASDTNDNTDDSPGLDDTVTVGTIALNSAEFSDGNSESDTISILGSVLNTAGGVANSITVGFGNIAGNVGLGNVEAGNVAVQIGNSGNIGIGNVEVGNDGESLDITLGEGVDLGNVGNSPDIDITVGNIDTTETDTDTGGDVSVEIKDEDGNTIGEDSITVGNQGQN
ncbi:beta strand repeat-containing protein [Halorubrum sp. FL23]|uniref:beta strand repeat-containing protein n=1 Tax=Halorubrum sp. FL23 TaxID=3458704 RepID=UPI004033534C